MILKVQFIEKIKQWTLNWPMKNSFQIFYFSVILKGKNYTLHIWRNADKKFKKQRISRVNNGSTLKNYRSSLSKPREFGLSQKPSHATVPLKRQSPWMGCEQGGGGIQLKKNNDKECYNKCEENFRYLYNVQSSFYLKVLSARLDLHQSGAIGQALKKSPTAIGFRFFNFSFNI